VRLAIGNSRVSAVSRVLSSHRYAHIRRSNEVLGIKAEALERFGATLLTIKSGTRSKLDMKDDADDGGDRKNMFVTAMSWAETS